ncbi:diacylglycerol/lipid kinase family protein [Pseudonocardia sp. RS010]|uniref:diacylglycerol/lipid kinase family protein n=1 Tax=Pseudonocardia sp. RS010 TaxID=3385979 RepID=UPI0039A10205
MSAAEPGRRQRKARLVVGGLTLVLGTGAAVGRVRALRRAQRPLGTVVPAGDHPVLFMNPRSGGGKAERFGLPGECRARGIEPVLLGPGHDLVELAEAAVAGGADVLGMAGGDGSQALIAEVAARHGLAMVVVPAGTRNHLAMDLGLDRDDVVGALDAFGAAVERRIDLGDVNGRPFVNNVSLGLYAEIVRLPEYRDAKIETTLSTLPGLLEPGRPPFDLRFTGPAGERHTGAHVVQVSNNPYGRTIGSFVSRPRLDTGHLGVIALELPGDPADRALLAAVAAGRPERFPGYVAWTPSTFEVSSDAPVNAGVDGEALQVAPPLHFRTRPGALRIRLPLHASGLSPAARELRARSTVRGSRYSVSGRR